MLNFLNALTQGKETGKTLDERWKYLKNNLINVIKQVCEVSAKHTWKRQTWWWNDKVSKLGPTNANVSKYGKQKETDLSDC